MNNIDEAFRIGAAFALMCAVANIIGIIVPKLGDAAAVVGLSAISVTLVLPLVAWLAAKTNNKPNTTRGRRNNEE